MTRSTSFWPRSRRAASTCHALALAGALLTPGAGAQAGEVYTGAWGGLVPASLEFLSENALKICQEDLVRQCQFPVPFHREGETIVVEHLTSGRRWTYAPRPGGGYDAEYLRWNGQGYDLLTRAVLRAE